MTKQTTDMLMRSGIPTMTELDELLKSDLFREHVDFNERFLKRHANVMGKYARNWTSNPMKLWSRRWEYPYTAQRILEFAQQRAGQPIHILDAGSGVTYLPYYLCETIPNARVTCCDSNFSFGKVFEAINRQADSDRVSFVGGTLQRLPLPDHSVDAISCVSVLEHTGNFQRIADDFHRVLRPGGLLAVTFDIGIDLKFEVLPKNCPELLNAFFDKFQPVGPEENWLAEMKRIEKPADLLTTDAFRHTRPDLLPWKYPMLQSVMDVIRGSGWTGGFRSVAIFCFAATARGA